MKLPEFTVVIPAYNGSKYLTATLETVLAQTHKAHEVIVVDDGSTDATADVVRTFGEKVTLLQQPNQGVAAARNAGIWQASTPWIAFMDSDDLWNPGHLANIADAIATAPAADICYTGRRHVVEQSDGAVTEQGRIHSVPDTAHVALELLRRCPFPPSCVAIRTSLLKHLGGFNGHFSPSEDWEMWLRLLSVDAVFVHAPEPTLLYLVHPGSLSSNAFKMLRAGKRTVRDRVVHQLKPKLRQIHTHRVLSRLEGEASIALRENKQPGALPMMIRSIARHPFHDFRRYKIVLHMLLYGSAKVIPASL